MKAFTTAAIAMSMAMAALAAPEVAQSNMLNSLTDRQFDSYEAPSAAPISGGDVSWTTVTNTGSSSSWSSQGAASDYGQYDAGLTTGNNAGLSFGGSFDLGLPGFVQNLLYSALIIMGLTSLFGIAKNLITQFKPDLFKNLFKASARSMNDPEFVSNILMNIENFAGQFQQKMQ